MKSKKRAESSVTQAGEKAVPGRGRWIRPVKARSRSVSSSTGSSLLGDGPSGANPTDEVAGMIMRETRKRVSGLTVLERELEDRILQRWEEAETEASRRLALAEDKVSSARKRAESEAKERGLRLEKEGRAAGFREGFARGRDEGYRLGLEEGRRDGEREGHKEASGRVDEEISGAAQALASAAHDIRDEKEAILRAARSDLLKLAVEIAKKLVNRELSETSDIPQRNVERAIELIFRRGSLVIQVHPEDAVAVENALEAEPRWAEGFDAIEVRPAPDVGRGGCRLISGTGTVDMTLDTQLSLIESALNGSVGGPWSDDGAEEKPGVSTESREPGPEAPEGASP